MQNCKKTYLKRRWVGFTNKLSGLQQGFYDPLPSQRRYRVARHVHGQSVVVRAQGVCRERHGGHGLAGAEHPHSITVDQRPAVQGSDGADRPVDIAPGGAGTLAVVGHDETVAEALAPVAHSVERGLGPAWFIDQRPAPGVEVEEAGGRHMPFLRQL